MLFNDDVIIYNVAHECIQQYQERKRSAQSLKTYRVLLECFYIQALSVNNVRCHTHLVPPLTTCGHSFRTQRLAANARPHSSHKQIIKLQTTVCLKFKVDKM